jgi:hypothetical protein
MACDSETTAAPGAGDGAAKALPPRRWLTALGIYLAASFLWAATAPAAMTQGIFGLLGLGPVTPVFGRFIGDVLTGPKDDSDEGDREDTLFTPQNFAFASIYSLVVLSPSLMWLRTRKSGWRDLQGFVLALSAFGTAAFVGWTLMHIAL